MESKWISVKERLPEFVYDGDIYSTSRMIIVAKYTILGEREVSVGYYEKDTVRGKKVERWKDLHGRISTEVTHWMPFPELPENE